MCFVAPVVLPSSPANVVSISWANLSLQVYNVQPPNIFTSNQNSMACQCILGSYSSSSLSPNPKPKTLNKNPPKPLASSSISSHLSTTYDNDENDKTHKPNFDFLKLSVTLTVISTALPQIPTGIATVKETKRVPKKSMLKKSEALSHQELESWSQGLPIVSNRIPYTKLLIFNQEGKLKRVIKPPSVELQKRLKPVVVLLGMLRKSST
ncbi:unnamed protein product [Prunus armeniaca]|uniref:Uncharacterized protein n=1 Tax=Prunus armeniaca TaxID=36596 RepID=A0A6J5V655_PRUAR|nr:unnamed protein product [Prunus armeniaca]